MLVKGHLVWQIMTLRWLIGFDWNRDSTLKRQSSKLGRCDWKGIVNVHLVTDFEVVSFHCTFEYWISTNIFLLYILVLNLNLCLSIVLQVPVFERMPFYCKFGFELIFFPIINPITDFDLIYFHCTSGYCIIIITITNCASILYVVVPTH